jgi:serine/threonine protein kinase/Tfp pilus assembly protein PilF
LARKCPKCHSENPDTKQFCADCGTQLPPPQGHAPVMTKTLQTPVRELPMGSTFASRYQVIEELGHGGMGRVYKVFDTKIKEKIALKLIKPEIASDKETIERFGNELRLARKISQRNVCRMFDMGEAEGAHFITMEYVHGEDLKSMIRMSGSLSLGMLLSVGKQVCDGLAEAHSLGVVHRDLKPQNIMIDKNGNAKIMDFGIARSVQEKGITGPAMMIGTPEYMSPEQAEAKEVDHRSDVYSLGVILYEMATSHVPFEGETALSIAMKHKVELPKDPKKLNPNIPDDLSGVILKCLEKDKAKRYQSASDVHSELEKIEKGIPTTERVVPERKTITSREITVKFRLRNLVLPAVALIALVVLAILGIRLLGRKSLVPALSGKPSLAVMYFENITGDAGLDHWRKALPMLLTTDLSQSKYVNVLPDDELYDLLNKLDQLNATSYSSRILKEIAARGGVNHILLGQLTRAGESFRLSYTLKKFGSGESVGSGWVAGEGIASFYPMIDALTRKVKEDLKLTKAEIAGDVDMELGKITTISPEAFLLYVEGREYHHKRDHAKSIELMKKAVAIDPGFAMAYRSLAVSYNNTYMLDESEKWMRKALELSDRVSEKERLLIEADYFSRTERTAAKAIEALGKLLAIYPDDAFANTKLAYQYLSYGIWDKAAEFSQAAIRNNARTYYPYSYLATIFEAQGQPEKAREAAELGIRTIGDNDSFRGDLSDYYLYQGRFKEALEENEKAIALSPESAQARMSQGNIFLYQDDFARAAEEFQSLLKLKDPSARLYYLWEMANLAVHQGKFKEARALIGQGIQALEKAGERQMAGAFRLRSAYSLYRTGHQQEAIGEYDRVRKEAIEADQWSPQRWALQGIGLTYCAMNSPGKARQAASELSQLVREAIDPTEAMRPELLLGSVELEQGHWNQAIELLKSAAGRLPHESGFPGDEQALFIERLALAYFGSGDFDKAAAEYRKIKALTTGRLSYGDIYACSFYMLGRIAEQKGDKASASESYAKFLALWKDADPGQPEVEDAKKRLAGLKAQ